MNNKNKFFDWKYRKNTAAFESATNYITHQNTFNTAIMLRKMNEYKILDHFFMAVFLVYASRVSSGFLFKILIISINY